MFPDRGLDRVSDGRLTEGIRCFSCLFQTLTVMVKGTALHHHGQGLGSPVVTERLVSDTGSSSTDHITSNDTLTGSGNANTLVTFKEGSTVLGYHPSSWREGR